MEKLVENTNNIAVAVRDGIIKAIAEFSKTYRIDILPGNNGYMIDVVNVKERNNDIH